MADSQPTQPGAETLEPQETSPLLERVPERALDANESDNDETDANSVPSATRLRVVALLCLLIFIQMLGDSLQPAALLQIYEDAICRSYYEGTGRDGSGGSCKAQPVQKELAFVRGFQQLVPVLAAICCTIPYGLLSQRLGRKPILILSGAGLFLQLAWTLAVCYWQFPIRTVWLSGLFLFVGGGDAVASTIAHIMVTDTVAEANRAQVFLYLHAADVVSGLFGPAISAPLMEKGQAWLVLWLSLLMLFLGAFILPAFMPETLDMQSRIRTISNEEQTSEDRSGSHPSKSRSLAADVQALLSPLFRVLLHNPQTLLLLCILTPQTAARELFNTVGLQYAGAKFALPYSRGNIYLSLFQGVQGFIVLFLLPTLNRSVAATRGWSPWFRDRFYTIMSISVTAAGLLTIAVAPALPVMAIGLFLVAFGSCTNGLIMSLLGATVGKNEIAAVYSIAPMLSMLFRGLDAPVVNALLVAGLELGRAWMGLPFGVMSLLVLCTSAAALRIRSEKPSTAHTGRETDCT